MQCPYSNCAGRRRGPRTIRASQATFERTSYTPAIIVSFTANLKCAESTIPSARAKAGIIYRTKEHTRCRHAGGFHDESDRSFI